MKIYMYMCACISVYVYVCACAYCMNAYASYHAYIYYNHMHESHTLCEMNGLRQHKKLGRS